MPVPVPAGALAAAHRICCLSCVHRMKNHGDHTCNFPKVPSIKCDSCTKQDGVCIPIPWFCGEEFDKLQAAASEDGVQEAAAALEAVVLVAAAEAPKDEDEFRVALLEEILALRREVKRIADDVYRIRRQMHPKVVRARHAETKEEEVKVEEGQGGGQA